MSRFPLTPRCPPMEKRGCHRRPRGPRWCPLFFKKKKDSFARRKLSHESRFKKSPPKKTVRVSTATFSAVPHQWRSKLNNVKDNAFSRSIWVKNNQKRQFNELILDLLGPGALPTWCEINNLWRMNTHDCGPPPSHSRKRISADYLGQPAVGGLCKQG